MKNTTEIKAIDLDFGSEPVISKKFQFVERKAVLTSNIVMVPAGNSDLEFDTFICGAHCETTGLITAYVTAIPGPVTGIHKFLYFIG